MIQQPESSLLLRKLLEFVVSKVIEDKSHRVWCNQGVPGVRKLLKSRREILTSWPHELCQVPHSDLYFQNTKSSVLEWWSKIPCAFQKNSRPSILLYCSLNSCCLWQLLGEGGVVVPMFAVGFGGWYHQYLLLNCWKNDQGVKQLQKRVFASVCKRAMPKFSQCISLCVCGVKASFVE